MLMSGPRGLCRWAQWATVMLLVCGPSGECCGPGRRGGRRRSPRKLMPLVFKEHVPNVDENTLGASGLTEGHISHQDPRFHELGPNYNADVYFRDEEGTGEDRLMTERCKERLNMLTISVMNQWPKVRLRVLDGWDASGKHVPNSLHYEGRAVDITTSDRDRSKLGMLARLAVEAGFDWVFYESRSHIHCSVKSESRARKRLTGCFPGQANVRTPEGEAPIGALQEGDMVQVLRGDGSLAFSPIRLFLHKDPEAVSSFLMLATASGKSISLTPSHLVFVLRQEKSSAEPVLEEALELGEAVMAGTVRPGDFVMLTEATGGIALHNITSFNSSWEPGVFAPLTEEGTVVVNDVVASCYAVIDSQAIAHWAFLPVRIYFRIKDTVVAMLHTVGVTSDVSEKDKKLQHRARVSSYMNYLTEARQKLQNATEHWPSSRSYFEEKPPHIHWYASMLYNIASWVLPRHLVDS